MLVYLTPAAIGYLTQFIMALTIMGYFGYRSVVAWRRHEKSVHTPLLATFFASVAVIVLLFFLDAALPPSPRLHAVYAENTAVGLFLTLLIQFAYRFPRLYPQRKWEARIALVLSLLYTLWEAGFAVYRGEVLLQRAYVIYRPLAADYALAAGFLWAPLAFLRQTIAASRHERDLPGPLGLRHLWRPQGRAARAVRAFALVFLLPLALSLVNILRSVYSISPAVYQSSMSAGILLTQFTFATVYLNTIPEITTFRLRLAGITLVTVLAVFGAVGWVMTPPHAAICRPALVDQQTLRFTPNVGGGYDVTQVPFRFDADLGDKLDLERLGTNLEATKDVSFTFPFYGQTSETIYVLSTGAVGVGHPIRYPNMEYHYATTPAIFPLFIALNSEASGGVFAKNEGEHLTVTWYQMPAFYYPQAAFTFQLVLYRDGVFDITYNGLPDLPYGSDASPFVNAWIVGASPGTPGQLPRQVNFTNLPLQGSAQGMIQDHYLAFRRHLHQLLLPLAILIVVSSLLVVVGFPIAFYVNLVRPLNALLDGVRRVNAGDLETEMPVQYYDEIGFLTRAFNDMVAQLRELVTTLEARVARRTQQLAQQNIELAQARDTAEAANRAKSAFLANISHELRTPLSAILGFSDLLARDRGLTAEQRESLGIINRSGEHLLALINDVLAIAKIEAGRVMLQENTFDLHQLLADLAEMFRVRAANKGLMLKYHLSSDVPRYVITDEGKLRQILINLLGNAVKFTNEGGIELRVKQIDAAANRGMDEPPVRLNFEIQDTGIGIAPAMLETIFEPFVQIDDGKTWAEGSGLGLAISRQFTRLMGGDLRASSEGVPGKGTLLSLTIPVAPAQEDVAANLAKAARPAAVGLAPGQFAADGNPYRLLVADDAPETCDLLTRMLSQLGFEVRTVANGQEAIDVWQTWRSHLIWMDIRMPVMDGHEATRRIKATPEGRATVIVALTASAFEEERQQVLAEGCDDFVRKPFRQHEIEDVLVKHLGVRFVYEALESALPAGDAQRPASELEALPADWLAELRRAVIEADADKLTALAERIREQRPMLAAALLEWTNAFDYDAILAAIAQPTPEGNE